MDTEVYEIMKRVLNVDDFRQEICEANEIVKNIIEEKNINKKTELLIEIIELQSSIYKDIKENKQLSKSTNNLLNTVYIKLYFDCILQINDDITDFLPISTICKASGNINEKIHPYLKMLLKINNNLENSIKYMYENYNNLDKEYFIITRDNILELLNNYEDDTTNWNKIKEL